MPKIYTVNNGENDSDKIPSLEYIKALEVNLFNILNKICDVESSLVPTATSSKALPVGVEEMPKINANDVNTDANHRFITDSMIDSFNNDKPSRYELNKAINDLKVEIDKQINSMYTKILNTSNAVSKLREISELLNEDDVFDKLMQIVSDKVTVDELNNHINSGTHLTDNDRKILNRLISIIKGDSGIADWNSIEGDIGYIKNKPKSMRAKGGNSDTVGNNTPLQLLKNEVDTIVAEFNKYNTSIDLCDIPVLPFQRMTENNVNDIINGGDIVYFKKGTYKFPFDYELATIHNQTFKGQSAKHVVIKDAKILFNQSDISNITFSYCTITIKNGCNITNCNFVDCNIIFDASNSSKFCMNTLNNCNTSFNGILHHNIISMNIFKEKKLFKYLIKGSNIITNNTSD